MSSNLNRNQHSVYILTYHLVLVIKYRRKVINEDIFDSLMVIFKNIGFKYDFASASLTRFTRFEARVLKFLHD